MTRILFLLGATSRIRNFHDALIQLADDGHEIRLAGRLRKGAFDIGKAIEHPRIAGRVNPTERSDGWRDVVDLLRGARDYVRYFHPRYAQAHRLVRRAYEIAPTAFVLYCDRHPWVRRHWALAARALAAAETLVPSDPAFEAFLREERPDVVVVTPLVTFESYQTDYVKAAHALGLPVVFIPFSWDNLTNKGLMRVQPDRVLVWNDVQRREAIDLHGCPPERIVVTGAARFDSFFRRTVSTSREEFCAEYGLDPARPLILYLGSSQLTGPNEMELVRRWAEGIRASEDEALRSANLLVRPHPALKASWMSVDLSDLGRVALSLTARRDGDQELCDSLHHAHAAVGLNTSAMLEAAVAGTPVHTLMIPGFDAGQVGTMHFHYLVEAYGGVAAVARDFAEHHRQLAEVVAGPRRVSERSLGFAGAFLRPHGIEGEVSPLLAAEILRGASVRKTAARTPAWRAPLAAGLLWWLRRRTARTHLADDTSIIARSMSLRMVRTALEELQAGTGPVFVGPWADSAANELLYWVPFVRRMAAVYGLPPERLIALSCTGSRDWYGALAARFLDARTLFSPDELDHWQRRTVPQSEQDPKQAVIPPFDQEILDRATRAFDLSSYDVLHPSSLFRVLRRLQKDRATGELDGVLQFERSVPAGDGPEGALPGRFVAMSLAATPALPATDTNVALLGERLEAMSARTDVVVVDPPGAEIPAHPRIHRLDPALTGGDRAAAQTRVLARARKFVGGFGDLAVLAASCGTAATAYFSERLAPDTDERLRRAAATGGWGEVTIERARRPKPAATMEHQG